jgi:hypothetical protein
VTPQLSAIHATATTLNGQPAVRLEVVVSEVVPLQSVVFLDGEIELGPGVLSDGAWAITVPVDPAAVIKPYFIARALSELGQAGYSPVLRYGLKEADRFAVVDENGQPTGEGASTRGSLVCPSCS